MDHCADANDVLLLDTNNGSTMKEKTPADFLNDLISQYPSVREFSRAIGEDASDVVKWRYSKCAIRVRAVISICRIHPNIKPHDLNPLWFPADLDFKFGDNNE